mgnify:CR=1 FL=1
MWRPPALSDALAARSGTSPLTIKYIWSPTVLRGATGRLLGEPLSAPPNSLVVQGQTALGKGEAVALHL